MSTRSLTPLPKGFHGDVHLLRLVDLLAARARTFLETGANVGSTLGYVARRFAGLRCLACEPDAEAHAVATAHAVVRTGVDLFHETSQEFLRRLARDHAATFDQPVLAWLDAHGYGFEWPLRDEVRFLTSRYTRGAILIDDFRVPHDPRFGFDRYGDQECSFEYVRDAIAPGTHWRLYYPAYSEHTSPWHPLRGFGLLQFDRRGPELEPLDGELSEVIRRSESSAAPATPAAAPAPDAAALAFARGDFRNAAELLRRELAADGARADRWNDLGVCCARLEDGAAAVAAFGEALRRDPAHRFARANLKLVLQALHGTEERPLPVAPGPWGRDVARDPYADLRELITVERPTLVDGGANRGDTVARLRGLFPDARIHAFEPIDELAQSLRARFPADRDLVVHAAALAAEGGKLSFHRLRADVTSSALVPSALKRRYQGERVDVAAELEVLALPLAEAVPERIDAVKLDLQGFELAALRGLGPRLAEVRAVLTEVVFTPLYDGQPLFADLDAFLRAQGFRLFHLYEVWTHPDGQITAGDALYVNERHFT